MSSILEHMCADVFQQTGLLLRSQLEGQEPIPYRNLLPAKEPIHEALRRQFQAVLRKGWVDSRALHLFESLLHIGGVFWFTNNLVKVGSSPPAPDGNTEPNVMYCLWVGMRFALSCVFTRVVTEY